MRFSHWEELLLGKAHQQMISLNYGANSACLLMHPEAHDAFKVLQAAARLDDIDCQIASAFRDYRKQKQIWDEKWQGIRPIVDPLGKVLATNQLSDEQKLHAILRFTALPGSSRHHWGTDIDVFDKFSCQQQNHQLQLEEREYSGSGPCARLSEWLMDNAHKYGFILPYKYNYGGVATEPWHLSYLPVARKLEALRNPSIILFALRMDPPLGMPSIDEHFTKIYERYVLNYGNR